MKQNLTYERTVICSLILLLINTNTSTFEASELEISSKKVDVK